MMTRRVNCSVCCHINRDRKDLPEVIVVFVVKDPVNGRHLNGYYLSPQLFYAQLHHYHHRPTQIPTIALFIEHLKR